jgi:alkaline phosphatase
MLGLGLEFFDTEKPFFFMCEGGKIDWTAHGNRTMPMVMDVLEFDEAIAKAYEFYKSNPEETLIVVTADHETGGLTLGCGESTINWEKLEKQWLDEGKKNTLSDEENRKLNQECSIGWTTGSHTGGPVPVFAVGKGAEKFAGRMDNTEFKVKILGE